MSSTSELVALQQKQELAMYRCTSEDTSLHIYSPARTTSLQMEKEDSVRFQITNQSENVSKAPSEKIIMDNPQTAMEGALSEDEDLGFIGRSRKIVESFNMEDFWHALFLGKYFFLSDVFDKLLMLNIL